MNTYGANIQLYPIAHQAKPYSAISVENYAINPAYVSLANQHVPVQNAHNNDFSTKEMVDFMQLKPQYGADVGGTYMTPEECKHHNILQSESNYDLSEDCFKQNLYSGLNDT